MVGNYNQCYPRVTTHTHVLCHRSGRVRVGDQEVERLLGLGAKGHEDHRTPGGPGWFALLDPEGNEFCVCRSRAEREAAGG
nr:VOC family protein [Microbispora sp. ATCC PTA-5024]